MRPVNLIGSPSGNPSEWFEDALREIERASQEADVGQIADAYTIAHPPASPVRTLDVSTASLADLVAFVATLVLDLKARGVSRGS